MGTLVAHNAAKVMRKMAVGDPHYRSRLLFVLYCGVLDLESV